MTLQQQHQQQQQQPTERRNGRRASPCSDCGHRDWISKPERYECSCLCHVLATVD